jgi:hypothetical protein
MPAVIHSATIRSGLEVAGASHQRYGAQLLRSASSVQHVFVELFDEVYINK